MKTARTITAEFVQRERVVVMLIGLIFALGTYYAVLINQTILNAVEQRKIEGAVGEIQKNIADLELAFIENESDVNLDYAYANGFQDVEERHFVTRSTNLTLR